MDLKVLFSKQLENDKIHHAYILGGHYADSESIIEYIVGILQVSQADILRVESDETISINEVKILKKEMSFAPFNSKWKIAIINPADSMTTEAQNALLKILEEPAKQAVILLIVKDESTILSTIKSRCQMIKLGGDGKIWEDKELKIPESLLGGGLSYSERFNLAESLSKDGNLVKVLDGWLVHLSNLVLQLPKEKRYLDLIGEIGETKDRLKSNANSKVLLESLLMKF